MVVDEDQTRKNIGKIKSLAELHKKNLRPHSKTHKMPEISQWQISAGAIGICVQKVSEAEIMFAGGLDNILISNEVVDPRKTDRICNLSSSGCEISVAVDSIVGAQTLSRSALDFGLRIPILVDIDLGMHRCGIPPERIEDFLGAIERLKGLRIEGIMGYDGNVQEESPNGRRVAVEKESGLLRPSVKSLSKDSEHSHTVSVAGTPSADAWAEVDYVTELQPGTYVYYDCHCAQMNLCETREISMGVIAQVMSKSADDPRRVVLDAGSKSVSMDHPVFPKVVDLEGGQSRVVAMSEEHTVLVQDKANLNLKDRVVLLPYHACTTSDLWDIAWVFSKNHEPKSIPVKARGKRE